MREEIGTLFCTIAQVFKGCKSAPILRPTDYPVFETTWQEILSSLTALGLVPMQKDEDLPDIHFYYTDEAHWREIIKYLTYPADYYVQQERKDCDDYSKKASADSSFYFGLNCLQDWGDTPYGYHAFSKVEVAPNVWKIFEPNAVYPCAGELMDFNNKYGWRPIKWKV